MKVPQGFLGSRADLMMDLVMVAFVIILPIMIWSWRQVRTGQYNTHRNTQLALGVTLAIAVALFELNLKISGGIFVLTAESSYANTSLLNGLIYGHTLVAVITSIIWIVLLILSPKRFGKPPKPSAFSRAHRFWGRTGMIAMMATGLSAIPLYYVGFVL